ncbi:MAG: DUF5678 domain-containing protein [Bryobacteraceae bacterium]
MAAKKKGTLVDVAEIGALGGSARAANLTPRERRQSASEAARARWDAYYAAHPEKVATKRTERKKNSAKAAGSSGQPKKQKKRLKLNATSSRRLEQAWLNRHNAEYAGRWVALEGAKLVAHGSSAQQVLDAAKLRGYEQPLVVHIPSEPLLPFGGW